MDQVLNADDSVLTKGFLDNGVVSKGNALALNLSVSTLVDQGADRGKVGVAISNIRLNDAEHLSSSLGKLDKDTVIDLEQTQELEDLARLGGDLVDTLDTDNEDKLGLSRDVEAALFLGKTVQTDLLLLLLTVLLDVLLSTLEDDLALLLVGLITESVKILQKF